jgi:hypothetical protein
VFVVGIPRSGTTLLGYLLAGGENVLCLSEPFFLRMVTPRRLLPWSLRWLHRAINIRHAPPPGSCDDERFLRYLEELADRHGSSFLVIKETYRVGPAWENVEVLDRLAAGSDSVVAIVRDPYDTALSTLRFWRLWPARLQAVERTLYRMVGLLGQVPPQFSDGRDLVHYVARNWVDFADWCQRHSLYVVRYEDLVHDPRPRLRELCEHCGLLFDERMLDHLHPRRSFAGIGDPGMMNRPPKPVSVHSTGRRYQLAPEYRQIVAGKCASAAAALGYAL